MNGENSIIAIVLIAIALLFDSCASTVSITDLQQEADSAYDSGKFQQALKHYENLIQKWNANHQQENNPYYDKAGHAALGMNDMNLALEYFSQSIHYGKASSKTFQNLIRHYQAANNISREMMTIEDYIAAYPDDSLAQSNQSRLFEIYAVTSQWEKAIRQWENIDDKDDIPLLELYFDANKQLENTSICEQVANKLLIKDPDNLKALEWEAAKYYDRAEKRYAKELEAYEQNKTRRQYAILLEGYEIAGKDYRKARDLYEKLYSLNPDRRYAIYLHNIYARFQDEEKASFYRNKMK